MIFILSALWWIRVRGLWKLHFGRDWLWGDLHLAFMGGAVFPPCSLASGQTMVGIIVVMASFKMTYACGSQDCCSQCPWPCSRPLLTHASTKESWRLTGKSGSVSCGVTAPFSWVLVHTRFCFSGGSLEHLWRIWALILNTILPLPPSRLGFSFGLGHGVSFFDGIHNSLVNGCSAASCNFGVLTGEDEHTSFYSTILMNYSEKGERKLLT